MKRKLACACIVAFLAVAGFSQAVRSLIGTVAGIDPQSAELTFKPDNGEPLTVKLSSGTVFQRVAPGERDLKKAEPVQVSEIAAGDRVLVSIDTATNLARRMVVMSAADIGKRNQADRREWIEHGVSGVVAAKKNDEVTVAIKSAGAEKTVLVTVAPATVYRRYAPDSVRFADARPSKLEDIQTGDQLRARGQKSADGTKLAAEEVVFGTFLTKAGSVTSIDAGAREIHLTELGTGKPLVVRLTADTSIKAMPDFSGGPPQFPGQGPPRRAPAAQGVPPFGVPGGRGGAGFAPPDPAEMIDRLPPATIDAVKPGQSIVVLSTKGANADQLTAITLVANAQMLIQMATLRSGGAGQRGQDAAAPGLSPGVMGGFDLGGMGLSGMAP